MKIQHGLAFIALACALSCEDTDDLPDRNPIGHQSDTAKTKWNSMIPSHAGPDTVYIHDTVYLLPPSPSPQSYTVVMGNIFSTIYYRIPDLSERGVIWRTTISNHGRWEGSYAPGAGGGYVTPSYEIHIYELELPNSGQYTIVYEHKGVEKYATGLFQIENSGTQKSNSRAASIFVIIIASAIAIGVVTNGALF